MKFIFNISSKLFILLLFFSSPSTFSQTGHVYVTGEFGLSGAKLGKSSPNIVYYNNLITDVYPANHNTTTTGLFGIRVGDEWAGQGIRPAVGIGLGMYGTPSTYNFNGQVIETTQDGPSNELYTYKYKISNIRLMLETQLTWMGWLHFISFVNFGIGSSWNHSSNYHETVAMSDGYLPLPPFKSHTNKNFAYQVGLGLGYAFNIKNAKDGFQHERVTIGYRFINLGKVGFGTRGSLYPYSLNTKQFTANEFSLSLTYLF